MLRFVIWGVGYRGKMLLKCLDKSRVKAFIDNKEELQGTDFQGIPIISFQSYLDYYRDFYIIVSPFILFSNRSLVDTIVKAGIKRYFLLQRCPMELPYYEGELPFKEMVSSIVSIKKDEGILLAGVNLFSILLYEFMKAAGYYNTSLYDCSEQSSIIREIKKDKDYSFASNDDISNYDRIIKTDRFLDCANKLSVSNGTLFYRFPYLKRYSYKSVEKFHDLHLGMRCFIVATGPSLQISDLNKLHEQGELSLSVNNIYRCFDLTAWRPNYLAVTDTATLSIYKNEILEAEIGYKFLADRQYELWKDIDQSNVFLIHNFYEYYEQEGPDFSSNIGEGTFYGGSVVYFTLQIAVYMGFNEIYLVGADCNYTGDNSQLTFPEFKEILASSGFVRCALCSTITRAYELCITEKVFVIKMKMPQR